VPFAAFFFFTTVYTICSSLSFWQHSRIGGLGLMNFTHLKVFYSVVKYQSFTQAARELNVSQPTLSLQVQNLEKQYDMPLLK